MNTKKKAVKKTEAKSVPKPAGLDAAVKKHKAKKRRMLIEDVAPEVMPSTALSAEALERAKVLTFPCKDCGAETNPSNRSILQDGKVVHIGCPKAPKKTSPREIEKQKPVLSGLPKHKGAKVPVREVQKVGKFGDMIVMSDFQGRTCIQLKRDVNTVTYLPTYTQEGYHLTYATVQKFDERFKPIEYPLEKACLHVMKHAVETGATQDVLGYIGRVVTITEEQSTMAKTKLAAKTGSTGSTEGGAKKGRAAGGERKESASGMFKELIMKGGLTDSQIFAKVKEKFGLDDKKRGYVAWYRNFLKKAGQKPPDAKPEAGEKKAAASKKEKAPAKKPAAKGKAKK